MLFPQKINVVASARHANPHNETVVVQNDTAVEFYVAVVGDNGQTELPEGATYTLVCLHLRKQPTEKLGTLQADGNVMFKLTHMELSETGPVQGQVRVYHPVGGRLTSNPFIFHVAPDPTYGAEIKPEDQSIIEQVIGEGPAIIAEAKEETTKNITERARLTGAVGDALDSLEQDKTDALLEMSQSKTAADESAQTALQAADDADQERDRLTQEVSDKITEVESARTATVEATGEALDAADLATQEADAARLQKDEVADILGAGPVASVNGKTGVVEGLATQESVNQVTAQLADTVTNVKTFGAVADANYYDATNKKYYSDAAMTKPATDNKPAFQAAVDFLNVKGGGVLYVPAGTYAFRSGVQWKTKVSMKGNSVANTKFVTEGDIFDLFVAISYKSDGSDATNPAAWLEDCHFENFECDLEGLTSLYNNVNGKAFFMLYMRRGRFHNIVLKNTIGTALGCDFLPDTVISNVVVHRAGRNWGVPHPTYGIIEAGQSGIGIGTGALLEENVVVSNCFVYNCGNYGIFVETQGPTRPLSKFAKIINNHVEGNLDGLGNKGSGMAYFSGNSVFKNRRRGINVVERGKGDVISDNIIESNMGAGISIAATYLGDLSIKDNKVAYNGGHGIELTNDGVVKNLKNVLIATNKVHNNNFTGIMVAGTHKNISLKDNEVYNNGQASSNAYTNKGIYLDGALNGVNVTDNNIYDNQETKTQTTDLLLASAVTNYFVDGNDVGVVDNKSKNGTIGTNKGFNGFTRGTATFDVGIKTLYVNHFMGNLSGGSIPKTVMITPLGNERIWVSLMSEANRFQVSREVSTAAISFMWEVKL